MSLAPARVLPSATVVELATKLFQAVGASKEHGSAIAEVLTWASLRGIESHGVNRIPRYVDLLRSGVANPTPNLRVNQNAVGVSVILADRAPGPVALREAADLAVITGRETGVASVGVQGTVNTGAIGYYTDRIAQAGLVGLAFVAGMPNMGYLGVKGVAVGTSPLSIAVPAYGRPNVLLDMATATIALGKIAEYRDSLTPLPEGAAVDEDGKPTTNPAVAKMPLPLGGAKGSAMSLVFELITSVLVGAPIVEAFHGEVEGGRVPRQNALVIALDPAAFGDANEFTRSVSSTVETLKALPVADGHDAVLVPGERSSGVAAERSDTGVPISGKIWRDITAAANELEVDLPMTG